MLRCQYHVSDINIVPRTHWRRLCLVTTSIWRLLDITSTHCSSSANRYDCQHLCNASTIWNPMVVHILVHLCRHNIPRVTHIFALFSIWIEMSWSSVIIQNYLEPFGKWSRHHLLEICGDLCESMDLWSFKTQVQSHEVRTKGPREALLRLPITGNVSQVPFRCWHFPL